MVFDTCQAPLPGRDESNGAIYCYTFHVCLLLIRITCAFLHFSYSFGEGKTFLALTEIQMTP